MAIKARVRADGDTEYLYCECYTGLPKGPRALRWELESDRHQEVTWAKAAPNERQLLEVDDLIDDDVKAEWLQVDATDTGLDDIDGNDIFEYSVSRIDVSRDAGYMDALRTERDSLMNACEWEVRRHKDQEYNSDTTSLTAQQFTDLLTYRQALRDWPSTETNIYARTAPIRA